MGKAGALPSHGRAVVIGHLVAIVLFVTVYLIHPAGMMVAVCAVAIAALLIGFKVNKTADRLPWHLMLVGLALLFFVNVDSFINRDLVHSPIEDSMLNEVAQMIGYVALLASAVVVVLRHAPQDGGGVIDAALVGTGLAAPIWEFLLRPQMITTGASTTAQTVLLVETLVLLASIGALRQAAAQGGRDAGAHGGVGVRAAGHRAAHCVP
jgi:hypothetical protein